MIEIKLLGPKDVEQLSRVAPDVFDDPIKTASTWKFLNDPRHRLVVALDEGVVVGFVSSVVYLHPDKAAPELWINEIGVASTHHRQGLGRRLMQATLEEGKRSGCAQAWVLTERANTAALALYRSSGRMEENPDPVMFTCEL
jgi:aminoglycoside 6'-N-acetyltransferase I